MNKKHFIFFFISVLLILSFSAVGAQDETPSTSHGPISFPLMVTSIRFPATSSIWVATHTKT